MSDGAIAEWAMSDIEWTPVKVKLGDLSHWAENPVRLTKAQAKKLLKSTEKLGRMQTLAIGPPNGDGKHPLYDGHQRCNVWGPVFGMDLEINALQSSRPLTDDERNAVPVMLRTATGSFDWDVLSSWDAGALQMWGLDLEVLHGWNNDAMNLREMMNGEGEQVSPEDEWKGMPEFEQEDLTAFRSIVVHFASQGGVEDFSNLIGQELGEKMRSIWYPKAEKVNMTDVYIES